MTRTAAPRPGFPIIGGMDTKPELAAAILERVLDAGIQAQWATGDTVYGANHQLRDRLQARGHALPTGRGVCGSITPYSKRPGPGRYISALRSATRRSSARTHLIRRPHTPSRRPCEHRSGLPPTIRWAPPRTNRD